MSTLQRLVATFGILEDWFGKQPAYTQTSKEQQICCIYLSINLSRTSPLSVKMCRGTRDSQFLMCTRTLPFANFNLANFACGFRPASTTPFVRRVDLERLEEDPNFGRKIIFNDEAHF
ncbi:hypothetical protein J6590_003600 [Homalodisca vitripennis]|nr:hypothetical protein J6590_003600 [Homalodisca vitripennis]